jgi:uncharacterized membrane-anchored protein YjiN (DUF445 family)
LIEDHARRDLFRHRVMASGLLGVAAIVLIGSRYAGLSEFAGQWVRAACEAALVGGLADWFAVTAIFRHPLGLPIPHTAIIPKAKARIADGLGRFVAGNFLEPSVLSARLTELDLSGTLARWLSRKPVSDALAERLTSGLPVLLSAVEDQDVRKFVGDALAIKAAHADLAPFVVRFSRSLMMAGEHGPVIDAAARMGLALLARSESAIKAEITANSSWWVPRQVDHRLADVVMVALSNLLEELTRPNTGLRQDLEQQLARYIDLLDFDPQAKHAFESWKRRILAEPAAGAALAEVWDGVKSFALDKDSTLTPVISNAIQALGRALLADRSMADRLNRRLRALILGALTPMRSVIGGFITDVVMAWDSKTLTERLELSVGKDLQYIRISGTIVGAVIGSVLFLIHYWIDQS